jgi:hypothetical protein
MLMQDKVYIICGLCYIHSQTFTAACTQKSVALKTKFIHESNVYAEMETGETILAFANNEMLKMSTGIEPLQAVGRTQNTIPPNSP